MEIKSSKWYFGKFKHAHGHKEVINIKRSAFSFKSAQLIHNFLLESKDVERKEIMGFVPMVSKHIMVSSCIQVLIKPHVCCSLKRSTHRSPSPKESPKVPFLPTYPHPSPLQISLKRSPSPPSKEPTPPHPQTHPSSAYPYPVSAAYVPLAAANPSSNHHRNQSEVPLPSLPCFAELEPQPTQPTCWSIAMSALALSAAAHYSASERRADRWVDGAAVGGKRCGRFGRNL